jgi:hypothetical protein
LVQENLLSLSLQEHQPYPSLLENLVILKIQAVLAVQESLVGL